MPSHHCHPIVVVKLPLSNCRPRIAAVVVIDIVSVGSGGGIIAVAVAVAIAISPIAIVAVIVDVASSTSLCHHRRNGGGQVSLVLILRIPTKDIWQGRLWFVATVFLVITIPLTGGRQT
jgi:hypothetical protein